MNVLDGFCVCVGAWGMDGSWMPLPSRPRRYYDPASLVTGQARIVIVGSGIGILAAEIRIEAEFRLGIAAQSQNKSAKEEKSHRKQARPMLWQIGHRANAGRSTQENHRRFQVILCYGFIHLQIRRITDALVPVSLRSNLGFKHPIP